MSITITINGEDAAHARREMLALLGERNAVAYTWNEASQVIENDVTAGEIVDALQAAVAQAEDADGVEFPAAAAEPPKKRGRPRKASQMTSEEIDEAVAFTEALDAAHPPSAEEVAEKNALTGQIDIEDAIADSMATTPSTVEELTDETPQPADPAAGWTAEDGRNAARAMLARAPEVEVGNARLFKVLDSFGVKQVKALKEDQIEAFVIATTKEVF